MRKTAILLSVTLGIAAPAAGEDVTVRVEEFALGENTSVEVLTGADGTFLGIGRIVLAGRPMGGKFRPMQIEVVGRTDKYDVWHRPNPLVYVSRRVQQVEAGDGTLNVKVTLVCADGSSDLLDISFKKVTERFYETTAEGLEYSFAWSSPVRYAHQIRETSWWTFGGESVAGLRWISQNSGYGRGACDFVLGPNQSFGGRRAPGAVAAGDVRDETLSAASAKRNPIAFAYLRQKGARETRQGDGDFLTYSCRKDVAFLRYAAAASMNYWQFERRTDEPAVRFEEWYNEPLAHTVRTVPMVIAVLPLSGVNGWLTAREVVKAKLRRTAKMPDFAPLPWVAYTQYAIDEPEARTRQIPYEQALATMKQAGIKQYWWYGPWRSNWSEAARMTPEQIDRYGLYGHAVWDYDWARNKFDLPGLRDFMGKANEAGITAVLWATQTMSQISPHVLAHPDWTCRRSDGSLYNYIYDDLVGMNHASGYSGFFVERMTQRMREMPFRDLWLDSFFFSADILNWMDPELRPNMTAALETLRKLRAAGVDRIYTELNSPFALSSPTGILNKDDLTAGKNLHLLYDTALCDQTNLTPEVYFRCLAFKCCPQPYLRSYVERPDFLRRAGYVNRAYVQGLPRMKRCTMLSDDRGVLWRDEKGDVAVLFAFRSGAADFLPPDRKVREILTTQECQRKDGIPVVDAYKVYEIH